MLRTRLAAAALSSLTLLPGCGLLCGNGSAWCGRQDFSTIPVSYPGPMGGCAMPIPAGGPMMSGPIISGPVYPGPGMNGQPLNETLPPPYAPRIPKAGIEERKGKEFELEAGRGGPVLAIPATGTK